MNRYNGKGRAFRQALLFLPLGSQQTVVPLQVERKVWFWCQQKSVMMIKLCKLYF